MNASCNTSAASGGPRSGFVITLVWQEGRDIVRASLLSEQPKAEGRVKRRKEEGES